MSLSITIFKFPQRVPHTKFSSWHATQRNQSKTGDLEMLLKAVTDKPLIHNFLLLLIDQRIASRHAIAASKVIDTQWFHPNGFTASTFSTRNGNQPKFKASQLRLSRRFFLFVCTYNDTANRPGVIDPSLSCFHSLSRSRLDARWRNEDDWTAAHVGLCLDGPVDCPPAADRCYRSLLTAKVCSRNFNDSGEAARIFGLTAERRNAYATWQPWNSMQKKSFISWFLKW